MKISTALLFLLVLILSLSSQSVCAENGTVHFNVDGTVIDKITYEIIVYEREKTLAKLLENGYDVRHGVWKDPIKLRKKRIAQWRERRKHYDSYPLPRHIGK